MAVGDAVFCFDFLHGSKKEHIKNFSFRVQVYVRTAFVFSIICRPYAVTLDEMARQGSFPIVAPVKPYTEFALIYTSMNGLRSKSRAKHVNLLLGQAGDHPTPHA